MRALPKTRKPSFYYDYVRSPQWRKVRGDYLRRVGWQCEHCYVRRVSIVHHLDYSRLGCEQPADLFALCRDCHARLHSWPPRAANDNQMSLPLTP